MESSSLSARPVPMSTCMSFLLAHFFPLLLILPISFGVPAGDNFTAESHQNLHKRNGSLSSTLQVGTSIPEVLERVDPQWYTAVGGEGYGKICFESAGDWEQYIYVWKGLGPSSDSEGRVTYKATEKQFEYLKIRPPLFLKTGMSRPAYKVLILTMNARSDSRDATDNMVVAKSSEIVSEMSSLQSSFRVDPLLQRA